MVFISEGKIRYDIVYVMINYNWRSFLINDIFMFEFVMGLSLNLLKFVHIKMIYNFFKY